MGWLCTKRWDLSSACQLLFQLLMGGSKSLSTSAKKSKGVSACSEDQDEMAAVDDVWNRSCCALTCSQWLETKQISCCSFISVQRKEGHTYLQAKETLCEQGIEGHLLPKTPGSQKQNLWRTCSGTITSCSFTFLTPFCFQWKAAQLVITSVNVCWL